MADVRLEVRHLDSFGERDHAQLAALREQIDFGVPPYEWTPAADTPWRVLVWEDDVLVGHVGILERTIEVGGTPVHVAGLRSVMTAPSARGQGYGSRAVSLAGDHIRDQMPAARFGLLLCLDLRVPFYRRLGWEVVADTTTFDQPDGLTTNAINTMVRPFRGERWLAGAVYLRGRPW